ncbi:MAG: ATP-binding cassette domain-containing protein [Frisingicoccus sp.]
MSTENKEIIFKIRNLQTWFPITKGFMKKVVGHVKAVDDVSLDIYKGETLGIVGESGCGKSTFGKTVMMLEKPTGGQVMFNYDGDYKDITKFNKDEMFEFRKKVQMVFQDPYSALNPQKKITESFEEPLKTHGISSQSEKRSGNAAGIEDGKYPAGLSDALSARVFWWSASATLHCQGFGGHAGSSDL